MYIELKRICRKVYSKQLCCLLAGLAATINIYAYNMDGTPVPIKGSVPVTHYQMFMIGVAISYGIYLVIRARRRKRSNKFSSKESSEFQSKKIV